MAISCPKCGAALKQADLRTENPACPRCRSKLHVGLKSEWNYILLALATGAGIAVLLSVLLQKNGVTPIVYGLICAVVLLGLLKTLRWKLSLPLKVRVVPKYRMWTGKRDRSGDEIKPGTHS